MKIGIIREGKIPEDKRVVLLPKQCKEVVTKFPNVEIIVQPSKVRCIADEAYAGMGFEIKEDLSACDILMGIKEVPITDLIPQKIYFFFSHTIKKQSHNRKLLQAIIDKKITLIDYECLTNEKGARVVAFGYYAGLVGAYNGIRAYGIRYQLFNLQPAHERLSLEALEKEIAKVKLPPIKIVITGRGRVGKGAVEMLEMMQITKVSPQDFLEQNFAYPVYTQLASKHYYRSEENGITEEDFYHFPEKFHSTFQAYAKVADIFISTHFWNAKAPALFNKEDTLQPDFKIKVIADVTCDIDGSIPTTLKASTILDPFYDYDPQTNQVDKAFSSENNITVMAVDNLPCELPISASEAFGQQLIDNVLPALFYEDTTNIIERATIAKDGKLTPQFSYLEDFLNNK